jgi:hypothetical protein
MATIRREIVVATAPEAAWAAVRDVAATVSGLMDAGAAALQRTLTAG